jgi:hypothetical protein
MRATMPAQTNWTNGLGFRHLIEDGVAILQDRPVNPDRRQYVLDDLSGLVLRAKRGSDLVRNNALFVASSDRGAVESFSVLDRFLDEAENDHWKTVLEQAEEALNQLKVGNVPQEQLREAAIVLLRRILSGLTREPKPGIPSQPEEIRIGS